MYTIAPELKGRIIALVKFSKERWKLESLQKGKLYLNTLEYFRKLEEEENTRGMGDAHEGRFILNDLNFKMYDNETHELVFAGVAKQSAITSQEDSEKHVLCSCYIDYSNLSIYEEGKDYFKSNIVFTENEKKEFKEHFGEHVLIISFPQFIEQINEVFEKQGIEYVCNKIEYSDFSMNYTNRIQAFIGNNSDKYFWKDEYFKNQREYRLVILNRDSTEPLQLEIGDMSNFSFITTADDLFNNKFCIEPHFDPEKHLIPLD